ncbi:aminopeptidase N-like [Schistocerca piceifrons]|uniref:aminopeptidase N-like n=1 Tax=Schistocerca piceifrons TaxID=274613 RepID=UPI001F5E59B9|nr:aminopeptidase N-like [Schistocerca piceifrons]
MPLRSSRVVAALVAALAASTCASLVQLAPAVVGRWQARRTQWARAAAVTRLPLEVLPRHYALTVAPYFQPEGGFQKNQFQGHVAIDAIVNDAVGNLTNTITLHAASNLDFDKDTVNVVQYQQDPTRDTYVAVTSVDRDNATETATVRLVAEVSGEVRIEIWYTGQLAEDMDGFYVSTYEAAGETRYLAATQFEATSARKAFPCFDEPALKATFSMVIYPPHNYSALFNMDPIPAPTTTTTTTTTTTPTPQTTADNSPPLRSWPAPRSPAAAAAVANRTPVYFGTTNPMSTYLVAFVVYHEETFGALERKATETEGPIRVWSRAELGAQRGFALDVAAASLAAYGRLFPDYFLHMNTKLDQVAIPDFSAGAMENWGLVTYRERGVLIDEAESTTESRRSVVTTVAHELAHQWFGDLVSPDFWNVVWLNEGFATYWAYHADLGSIIEGWQLRDQFLAEEFTGALESDAAADTHPMTTEENTTAPFDDITYNKGGSILRMFSNWLGEDVFYERLNEYLISHLERRELAAQLTASRCSNYSSARPADLFEALAPGEPQLQERMAFWTSTAGYPVINVTKDGSQVQLKQVQHDTGGDLTARCWQWKFQLTPSGDGEAAAPWPIFITFNNGSQLGSDDVMQSVWMLDDQMDITVGLSEGELILLNYKWTGFYRVNYDRIGWQVVQAQLVSDHLVVPRETRAQLLSDSFNLARSGHLVWGPPLDISLYLSEERDYLPWAVAFRNLDFLDTALAPSEYYSSFKAYMQALLAQPYAALRFEVLPDDEHATRLLRVSVLRHACRVGYPPCLQAAADLAAVAFPEGGQNDGDGDGAASVEPDLRSTAYCVWAQDGELWGRLWQRYLDTAVATEKVELLSALGCSQDNATLYAYLTNALNASLVRPQDWTTVYAGVYSTPFGLQVAMDFIETRAADLSTQYLGALSSVPELQAVNASIQSAISKAEQQVAWGEAHVPEVGAWLDSAVASGSPAAVSTTLHLLLAAVGSIVLALLN